MIIVTASFSKGSVLKMFSIHTRMQNLRFEITTERFRKVPFSRRISGNGRPNRRNI